LYRSIFDLVRDFLRDEALDGEEKVLTRYLKPDLVIVDDMGLKNLPKRSGEFLFEVVMRRHQTRSTMMTSNRPLEDWGKLIGDVPSATAILDRFLHHADIVTMNGRSYRLRNRATGDQPGNGQNSATIEPVPDAEPKSKPAIPPTGSEGSSAAPRRRKNASPKNDTACES
jgi:hypothetical protein